MSTLLWGLSFLLVIAGVVGNYHYSDKSLLLRVLGLLIVFGFALGAAAATSHGKRLIQFAKESRLELRKVVWPNRQETVQMTGIVMAMVAVVSIVLWGVDALLLRLVGWIGGYGA